MNVHDAPAVALSVVLLIVAGLFARTLANLDGLDPGFEPAGLVMTSVSLQDARYASAERVNQLFDVSLDALAHTPGVESAAVSLGLPYSALLNSGFGFADRRDENNPLVSNFMYITPTFFDTLGVPLRSGRTFTATDGSGQPPVVIVNDAFVRYVTGGEDPTGRHLRFNNGDWRVVGIVGDVQTRSSGPSFPGMTRGPLEAPPIVFFPAAQISDAFARIVHQWFMPSLTVRMPAAINADVTLRRTLDEADASLPNTPVVRLSDLQAEATAFQRLLLTLAYGATRFVSSLLWGVGQHDPLTFAVIAGLLLVAATVASVLPALRIVRINPAQILRG